MQAQVLARSGRAVKHATALGVPLMRSEFDERLIQPNEFVVTDQDTP